MRPVIIIESPYRGRGVDAIRYLACCYLDSLDRGECPIATHSQYPLALDESDASRAIGKECHLALTQLRETDCHSHTGFSPIERRRYVDLGDSEGKNWNGVCSDVRRLKGRAKEIWERGEWPTNARWEATNEGT
jgi:hypothetical protein